MSTSSSTQAVSSDVAELKDMVRALILDRKNQTPASAPVKAVEQSCVTCGGGHSYQNCPATNSNMYHDNIQEYVSQAAAANFNQANSGYRPPMVSNQIRPPGFPPVQNPHANNQNNFNRGNNFNQNRGNNFNQGQIYRPPVHQPVVNQPVAHQGPAPQTHGVSKTDFERYVTANDAVLRNMQNQGQNLQSQMANLTDMLSKFVTANTASTSGSGTLPGNTVTNPKEDLKGITTRSGVTIQGPKAFNHDTEVTKDTMPPANNGSTEDVQPPVVQIQTRNPNPEPNVAPVVTPVPKASIPFPSRRNDERRKEKANDQIEKFYEIFRDLSFEISFTDALMLMPKFASTLKTLIGNKEKLSELARTPLNENCSAVILNKLPKKLGDPGRFLIPCEFTGITTCNALADLGASINLMPYSVWKDLALSELTPTCMTLELADRSITEPIGIAEDVFINVGKFQFPADFVVVDFEPDPRVPLILGRCFLKTSHALIDVYEGEITLRVGKEAITFNLDQTSKYTADYNHMTVNKIDVIDMACDEYSQEDTMPPANNGSTEDVQPPVVQIQTRNPNPEPNVAPVVTPVPKASIPFPSRRNDERRKEKANDQIEKFYEIFRDLSFEISFTDALMLMPKFASTLKTLIGNKEKLSELARTPLNENCSAVILNKLPKKLGDPGRFLIPCEFTGITTCNALADLGASINLMPYSVWKSLSLSELTPTCMTLELADRSITEPIGIAEDVFINVGKFQFPADFVVVDFEPDPRVPLILGRCFLKTSHALIDVYEGEITLRVGKEAITFNLDQTSKYTADYNHMTVNKIDVIDMACDEYSQEVLGFSNVIASGNPTPYSEPIVSTASPTLTPFGDSDFLLMEEADSFLALEDDPTSSEVDPTYQDPEGDILILEAILNSEPPPPLPNHEQYMPEVRKELKLCEAKTVEPSIDEPPEVELKELPPHLEYAFLEGDNKLPVIIAKDLKDEEKAALLKVLKSHKRAIAWSHKRAIAWKLSDIKGVSPEFCTHKILMEEDYEPSVQSQRRVNPKIHDVIKKEVEKLLDAGLIYPISDSPWVSPVHCVPKKGGMTVITNEENELIPTPIGSKIGDWHMY
ncbi:reverse transcriptase domain-containing protein [Tanacetum coccineum]